MNLDIFDWTKGPFKDVFKVFSSFTDVFLNLLKMLQYLPLLIIIGVVAFLFFEMIK